MSDNYYSELNENGVVTPFRDLAAFPRSEQAVLGASNLVDFKNTTAISPSEVTITSDGFTVGGTGSYISSKTPLQNLEVGKTYYASVKIDAITSTDARFAVRASNNSIKKSVTPTEVGKYSFDFTYASGDYLSILASMGTSETCSITISELQLALSADTPYASFSKTNEQLTDELSFTVSEATSANENVTVESSLNSVVKYGKLISFTVRFTLANATSTSDTYLINLPIPKGTYPMFTIRDRNAPFSDKCGSFLNPAGALGISGIELPAGTYQVSGTYICK